MKQGITILLATLFIVVIVGATVFVVIGSQSNTGNSVTINGGAVAADSQPVVGDLKNQLDDALSVQKEASKIFEETIAILQKEPQPQINDIVGIPAPAVPQPQPPAIAGQKGGERIVLTIMGVDYAFRWCPAGTFMMGSPESEREKIDHEESRKFAEHEILHPVTLSKGFWILETEVTQAMWKSVMKDNPSGFKSDDKLPVENVSWDDCQKFVKNLTFYAELDRRPDNAVPKGFKFSLPTEAQWEYACRAGTTTPFNFGDTLNGDKANCNGIVSYGTETIGIGTYLGKTTPVASYPPNAWGLYDMHGNVCEWCEDWYGAYPSVHVTDPTGTTTNSDGRVCRSGFCAFPAEFCRSAMRLQCLVKTCSPFGLPYCPC
jgi:formylglycine-generating enzyme required for sulfatase activity